MRNKALLLALLLLASSINATTIGFDLEICKDDTVTLLDVPDITSGLPRYLRSGGSGYKIVIKNNEGSIINEYSFPLYFYIMDGGPTDCDGISYSTNYIHDISKLEVYKNDKLIFQYKFPDYCTVDAKCSGAENVFSCPEDCNSGGKDEMCDEIKDGICDPDCGEKGNSFDVDCPNYLEPITSENIPLGELPEEEQQNLLLPLIILIAIIVGGAYFVIKSKQQSS